jgi:hypothetical protein
MAASLDVALEDNAEAAAGDFCIVSHSVRSDATNSTVWQSSKLHTTQVSSAYLLSTAGISTSQQYLDKALQNKQFADLQIVQSAISSGLHSILTKQLRQMGCPTWPSALPGVGKSSPGPVFTTILFLCGWELSPVTLSHRSLEKQPKDRFTSSRLVPSSCPSPCP